MGVVQLNHAVLFVSDLPRAVAFYQDVLGFQPVEMTPDGFDGAAFLRADGSTNDHDLGLFAVPGAAASQAGKETVGLYHLAWEVDTLGALQETQRRLEEAGALKGSSDHGTTKSLYGADPDGNEFEVVWLLPKDLLTEKDREKRKRIGRLDLAAELQRFGADTQGGIGISR